MIAHMTGNASHMTYLQELTPVFGQAMSEHKVSQHAVQLLEELEVLPVRERNHPFQHRQLLFLVDRHLSHSLHCFHN